MNEELIIKFSFVVVQGRKNHVSTTLEFFIPIYVNSNYVQDITYEFFHCIKISFGAITKYIN